MRLIRIIDRFILERPTLLNVDSICCIYKERYSQKEFDVLTNNGCTIRVDAVDLQSILDLIAESFTSSD